MSRAEFGPNGSVGFGVLALIGLPEKAWELRLRDMVVAVEKKQANAAAADTVRLPAWQPNGDLNRKMRPFGEETEEEDRRLEKAKAGMTRSSFSWCLADFNGEKGNGELRNWWVTQTAPLFDICQAPHLKFLTFPQGLLMEPNRTLKWFGSIQTLYSES